MIVLRHPYSDCPFKLTLGVSTPSLYTRKSRPIYELHSSKHIVRESDTDGEDWSEKGQGSGSLRTFHNHFETVDDLVARVGGDGHEHTCGIAESCTWNVKCEMSNVKCQMSMPLLMTNIRESLNSVNYGVSGGVDVVFADKQVHSNMHTYISRYVRTHKHT